MRRTPASALVAGLTAALGLAAAAPALAEPTTPLAPTLPYDVSYSAADNVEYLGRFPEHFGTAGGAVGDGVFYVTDPRGVYTYDTSTPSDPQLLDSLALYQTTIGAALAQEDVDTNGQILLVDAATSPAATSSQLRVVDVSDPQDLKLLASVPVTDHTWTCVTGTDDTGAQNGCASPTAAAAPSSTSPTRPSPRCSTPRGERPWATATAATARTRTTSRRSAPAWS